MTPTISIVEPLRDSSAGLLSREAPMSASPPYTRSVFLATCFEYFSYCEGVAEWTCSATATTFNVAFGGARPRIATGPSETFSTFSPMRTAETGAHPPVKERNRA